MNKIMHLFYRSITIFLILGCFLFNSKVSGHIFLKTLQSRYQNQAVYKNLLGISQAMAE